MSAFFLLNLLENLIDMLGPVYAPKLFFMEQSHFLNLWLTRCGQEIKYHNAAVIKTRQRRLQIRWQGSSNLGDFPFTMVMISTVWIIKLGPHSQINENRSRFYMVSGLDSRVLQLLRRRKRRKERRQLCNRSWVVEATKEEKQEEKRAGFLSKRFQSMYKIWRRRWQGVK